MIFETVYRCKHSNNIVTIPLDPEWAVLGIQLSGGLDSALLTYLTAKTIKENNLPIKIKIISNDVGNKPDYLPTARRVREKLHQLTLRDFNFDQWADPYEYSIPLRESTHPFKLYCGTNHIKALFNLGLIDYEYNGITLNPPDDVRQAFDSNELREAERDIPDTIYTSMWTARPLALCDKQGVIELYKEFNILYDIAPLTLSCDVSVHHMVDGKLPCRNCWWCSERSWGLSTNGEDPLL
jgi:hypothetical protein